MPASDQLGSTSRELTTKSHIHASTTGTRRDPPSSKRSEVVTLYTTAKIMAFPAKYASRNTNDGCKTDRVGTKGVA